MLLQNFFLCRPSPGISFLVTVLSGSSVGVLLTYAATNDYRSYAVFTARWGSNVPLGLNEFAQSTWLIAIALPLISAVVGSVRNRIPCDFALLFGTAGLVLGWFISATALRSDGLLVESVLGGLGTSFGTLFEVSRNDVAG